MDDSYKKWPPGLHMWFSVIIPSDEKIILKYLDSRPWSTALKRLTQQYGYSYDYTRKNTVPLPSSPIEGVLRLLTNHINAVYAPQFGVTFDRIIVNEYTQQQGIRPHIDKPDIFGPVVMGLTLGDSATMTFTNPNTREQVDVWLPPRSLVILSGDSRYVWTHEISPNINIKGPDGNKFRKADDYRRVSITFRSGV